MSFDGGLKNQPFGSKSLDMVLGALSYGKNIKNLTGSESDYLAKDKLLWLITL